MAGKRVAVVGATGVVGQTIVNVLEEREMVIDDYAPVATSRSQGQSVDGFGRAWPVRAADEVEFADFDVAFFTAGADVSREIVPRAVAAGCRVVDNTTAFRMQADVPLVVPEINGSEVSRDTPLVSCPNCTAINLVMALAPLRNVANMERVVVTSFQSVSGAGREALDELDQCTRADLEGVSAEPTIFAQNIAFNCIPHIGDLGPTGYTKEEEKIAEETRKILAMPDLQVMATAVRVPVRVAHALSVWVQFASDVTIGDVRDAWSSMPGLSYSGAVPTQRDVAGLDVVVTGRARMDPARRDAIAFWVVGDNLRKGAATNSVQIAERFLTM